jgi:ELWxxDGT repeat protein
MDIFLQMKTLINMKKGILLGLFLLPFCSILLGQTPSLLKDIYPLSGSSIGNASFFNNTAVIKDIFIFKADDSVNGYELWKSDGTLNGTIMLKDIIPNGSSFPNSFFTHNNLAMFSITKPNNKAELWRTDGTEKGTFSIWTDIGYYENNVPRIVVDTTMFLVGNGISLKDFNSLNYKKIISPETDNKLIKPVCIFLRK